MSVAVRNFAILQARNVIDPFGVVLRCALAMLVSSRWVV